MFKNVCVYLNENSKILEWNVSQCWGSRKNCWEIFNFVINIIQNVSGHSRWNEYEFWYWSISKLEPYCFESKKSNNSIKDSSESVEEPTENPTQRTGNKDWYQCGNCRAVELFEESIRKNVLKVMAKSLQSEMIERTHCNVVLQL